MDIINQIFLINTVKITNNQYELDIN